MTKIIRPWNEPWEHEEHIVYRGQPHSKTWEVGRFVTEEPSENMAHDWARAQLAAAAPALFRQARRYEWLLHRVYAEEAHQLDAVVLVDALTSLRRVIRQAGARASQGQALVEAPWP